MQTKMVAHTACAEHLPLSAPAMKVIDLYNACDCISWRWHSSFSEKHVHLRREETMASQSPSWSSSTQRTAAAHQTCWPGMGSTLKETMKERSRDLYISCIQTSLDMSESADKQESLEYRTL